MAIAYANSAGLGPISAKLTGPQTETEGQFLIIACILIVGAAIVFTGAATAGQIAPFREQHPCGGPPFNSR